MADEVTLIVAFRAREGADVDARSRRLRELAGGDVVAARQLFPGETEARLAAIFEVLLRPEASIDRVVGALQDDEEVEYAHTPAARHPRENP